MLAYNINDTMITVITNEGPIHVPRKGKRAADVLKAIADGETDPKVIKELADPTTFINTSSGGRIAIKGGVAMIDDQPLPTHLSKRLVQFVNDGIPVDHLVKFYERLQANPSKRAVQELFAFLEHGGMPITPEGKFLAYKSVRSDWMDHYTGKIANHIGNRIRMKRNLVCDDANKGCSVGFHAGSEAYATSFGGGDSIMLIVEIDPAHVVSVPHDCSCQKMRVCEYKVVAKYQKRMVDSGVKNSALPYNTEIIPEDDFDDGCYPEDIEVYTD